MYKKIDHCRICGNKNLTKFLDLGTQALNGVFPLPGESVGSMPVEAVYCSGHYPEVCNLIQLNHTYQLSSMYGDNYGYRSGLNNSMVEHLRGIVGDALDLQKGILQDGDLIIDIGSNDSTLLRSYKKFDKKLDLVGIDPTGLKFKEHYSDDIKLIPDFFGSPEVSAQLGGKKAKVITSIAMFYDLEDPISFCKEIEKCLDPVHGVWIFEQAYAPVTIEKNGIDCFCQEHLEYYGVRQIQWILQRAGLGIIKVDFNSANGGSFRVFASNLLSSRFQPDGEAINKIAEMEGDLFKTEEVFTQFSNRIEGEKNKLLAFLEQAKVEGKKVFGLGASTKFNVILQYYNVTPDLLPFISEVNEFKFGRLTPGTNIPIISEKEAEALAPDFYVVGPYHFKDNIIARMSTFLEKGGALVFPLPEFTIVTKN